VRAEPPLAIFVRIYRQLLHFRNPGGVWFVSAAVGGQRISMSEAALSAHPRPSFTEVREFTSGRQEKKRARQNALDLNDQARAAKESHVMLTANVVLLAQAAPTTTTGGSQQVIGGDKALALWVIAGFVLLAGVVVAVGRRVLEGSPLRLPRQRRDAATATARGQPPVSMRERRRATSPQDQTLVRSWIAISLVGGLLIFTAVSFWISDTTLRSTLVGGVIANVGAAVAFYFSSKSADQARQDILAASLPSTLTPSLIGDKPDVVNAKLASTSLRLQPTPPHPNADWQVVEQWPTPGATSAPGAAIAVTFAGPVPEPDGNDAPGGTTGA
jgi:hypothetical protein